MNFEKLPGPVKNSSQLAPDGLDRLQKVMRQAGWVIEYADLDLTGTTPTVEIKIYSAQGRHIMARVDSRGRCSIETFHRDVNLRMAENRRGRESLVRRSDDVFLGRTRHEGPRSMLRAMIGYLAGNAVHPVELRDMRTAWAGVMGGRVAILSASEELNK